MTTSLGTQTLALFFASLFAVTSTACSAPQRAPEATMAEDSSCASGACASRSDDRAHGPIISVTLPPPGPRAEDPCTIAIRIGADGATVVDDEPLEPEGLAAHVRARCPDPADARSVIAADPAAPHARSVAWIGALRAAGVTKFAITVRPTQPPHP